ncbi:uncharacterized protein LOC126776445 isoform X2 [Nymphalis io]|uniref:uncharacterized protein LOC126776445 isoform X2 n=1 Tax=Inachis io TaxID=171585 RepID=UPI00216A6544|nr:uncharacterized protein LOC126776445 isoform X2 [Nymphalis io]
MLIILVFNAIMIFPLVSTHSETIKNEEECKIADLCVHDKVPMCAIDSCGEMRTFIDTCDMHEFNCDNFKQRPIHECWVTCKRGRSFKKPEFRTDCNLNVKNRI